MNTKTTMHDRISAFADGELPDAQVDAVMKDLATPEGRAAWEAYHHAADVMRSEDMDVALSPGFSARMAARLDAEPTVLAPPPAVAADTGKQASRFCWRRFAAPALGAAAVAALAFILTPPGLKSLHNEPAGPVQAVATASQSISHASVIAAAAPAGAGGAIALRASDLEAYVQAHQPASPAVDGAAQFASPIVPDSSAAK
ncbi:sigma-E factor negative regulatory protein [Lacisediminimonas sp.]|uniref:sigma-E factor negative regulatory protein n=1 Tax=Lacisediminimonas sp. TaxID=3060582 RepID=UPI00271D2E6E|nr:sigma-E factor negative regulatory protein [Lacisediminimonas sp.]MDO8301371.1 sigma-E factor negative regulatory protein [Lacisediminimonas sp.]MDO9218932.1 sigma-E factor negative regulatory protein [Lacisediminimonas sp.]